MNTFNPGTDLSTLYSLRSNFTVIALTGRTGAGCSYASELLSKGFEEAEYPDPLNDDFSLKHNSYRKYKILYDFAKVNFSKYKKISYREILTLFILKYTKKDLIQFLGSVQVNEAIDRLKNSVLNKFPEDIAMIIPGFLTEEKSKVKGLFEHKITSDFSSEIEKIESLGEYEKLKDDLLRIDFNIIRNSRDEINCSKFVDFFYSNQFEMFSRKLHEILKSVSFAKHNIIFQLITNNVRRSNHPYQSKDTDATNIFAISETINLLIKSIRRIKNYEQTKVVIDSLRNPMEVMYFKQRYSAFYLIAINRDEAIIERNTKLKFGEEYPIINTILEQEYVGGKGSQFFKQYVRSCIEKADIHMTNRNEEETKQKNKEREFDKSDNTSPYYSFKMQLLKYVSLIEHPGLITPSPEERCMQLAYTAKYNSGCISRQVGAAITDENYSIKAIGWNNTPEGQVPCLLRQATDLLSLPISSNESELPNVASDLTINRSDIDAFTPFEKSDPLFRQTLKYHYEENLTNNSEYLKGRNVCFCFKSLHNSCFDGKNQVHTRSLHAEESAFLQITKYGGTPIKGGKLFTTASPCELCAKKAYQLGVKVIYYVDPYPGISQKQILEAGSKKPEVRLFNGAIGNAYHWLFESFMAYKDELSLLLGLQIKDLATLQRERIVQLEQDNMNLKSKIENR